MFEGKYDVVDSFYFMTTPTPLILFITLYLYCVLKIGPAFMNNRKPFSLLKVIRVYNIFQVLACAWFVFKFHSHGFTFRNIWRCVDSLKKGSEIKTMNCMWWFLMLRAFELIETVFFVLRKKQNQVSTLHLYHHISTLALLWLYFKYSSGMMELAIVVMNSSVHVVMYLYYFLSSFKRIAVIINGLKPFLTIIQLLQLVLMLGHCVVAIMPGCICGVSKLFYIQIANLSILIYFFMKFFIESYCNSNTNSKIISKDSDNNLKCD
ncbi:CLUMA_CG005598, isoform A [Clunio marinus]|uniref:Elongation of very long chain fatty acids protein n=1 Tax=Clunio marinus TaxID=568069 RepID=A0A1J1HWV5_9DIPT|nr:CLUMA_CG005598, isoform A [Clunio marinus]